MGPAIGHVVVSSVSRRLLYGSGARLSSFARPPFVLSRLEKPAPQEGPGFCYVARVVEGMDALDRERPTAEDKAGASVTSS
jgi:hypothetical protein